MNWIAKLIGNNYNDKEISKLNPLVQAINSYDEQWMSLTDSDIKAKTMEFKSRFIAGESLDDLLPEAFAAVKQVCRRMCGTSLPVKDGFQTWDMVPYDVQLIGGIVLHQGKIAEMRTGEGKTLVATLPAYLNALSGNPVHVITVNDYLASRDAEWMGHLYQWLGLTVGSINKYTPQQHHKAQYEADIIYVESTEIGFDYLRDNLEKNIENRRLLGRGLHFAIVDEADSVFIDEARTPMIMSQPNNEPIDKYIKYAQIVQTLVPSSKPKKVSKGFLAELLKNDEVEETNEIEGDYYLDEKSKAVTLSELGISKLEQILGVENIYRDLGYDEIHHIENALSAKAAYHEGKEYIIQGDEIVIVDENTGRIMPGRRFQGGLHQAIEAKERITIRQEAKTIATITYQHFFKLYAKLSGMTGTATTEGEELEKIYDLEVLSIPTNRPISRVDRNDRIFFDQNSKWKATIETAKFYHQVGQPILIGTSSVHTSELVSTLLRQANINHYVLNAKFFEQEATIVGNGGQFGSVVVATNMAGRGTDIKLEKGLNDRIAANYATWIRTTIAHNAQLGLELYIASQSELDLLLTALGDTAGLTLNQKITTKKDTQPYATLTINQSDITPTQWEVRDIQFGLFVLGTEKHESRRIDNQLRGRAGRQGDAGVSQFYVSFDDEIMRKMGGTSMQNILAMAGRFAGNQSELEEQLSSQPMFTNSIIRAQTQMEAHNYSTRKHLYDYDSVVNKQRLKVYGKRDEILAESKTNIKNQVIKTVLIDAIYILINSTEDNQNKEYDDVSARSLNLELAEYLKTLSQRIVVVTNARGNALDMIKNLLQDYQFEIVSYEGNPDKTDSKYFTTLASDFALDASCVLYVDHKQENLDSAIQAGITHTFLHTDIYTTIEQLGLSCKPYASVVYTSLDDSPIYTEVKGWISEIVGNLVSHHRKIRSSEEELLENFKQNFVIEWTPEMTADIDHKSDISAVATRLLVSQFERWSGMWDVTMVHNYLKNLYLDVLDEQWIEHIDTMQHLRDKVGLYGYAQQDPLLIYKAESYDLFEQLWLTIKSKVLNTVFRQIQQHDDTAIAASVASNVRSSENLVMETHDVVDVDHIITNNVEIESVIGDGLIETIEVNTSKALSGVQVITKADNGKVGPNDPCPCGSGKKYKKCHGMK